MGYWRQVELDEFMCGIDGRVVEEVSKREARDTYRFWGGSLSVDVDSPAVEVALGVCYVLTLPLLFLILPCLLTCLPTILLIPGTALLWSLTSLMSSPPIPLIFSPVLPLKPLPCAPLCAPSPILLIASLSSAPNVLTETIQNSGWLLEAILLIAIP